MTGLVNQELLLCNEYLAAENRVLRAHLPSRLRGTQSPAGYRAHCQAGHHPRLVSTLGGPEVRWILGSCLSPRPRVPAEVEALVVRFRAKTVAGDMTGLWARLPIWAIRFRIERSATSSVGTTSRQHPSGVARRAGRSSSGRPWSCWPEPTSS